MTMMASKKTYIGNWNDFYSLINPYNLHAITGGSIYANRGETAGQLLAMAVPNEEVDPVDGIFNFKYTIFDNTAEVNGGYFNDYLQKSIDGSFSNDGTHYKNTIVLSDNQYSHYYKSSLTTAIGDVLGADTLFSRIKGVGVN